VAIPPKGALGFTILLDDQDGVSLVSEATNDLPDASEVVDVTGDPGRARTFNPEIKSLLLYH
jgi:hypothetical protein